MCDRHCVSEITTTATTTVLPVAAAASLGLQLQLCGLLLLVGLLAGCACGLLWGNGHPRYQPHTAGRIVLHFMDSVAVSISVNGLRVATAVTTDDQGRRSVSVSVDAPGTDPLPDRASGAVPSAPSSAEPRAVPATVAADEEAEESPRQPAVDPFCLAFVSRLRGAGGQGEITALERIHRAWRAGWLARRALDQGLARLGERTPDSGRASRVYILLDPVPEGCPGAVPEARRFGTFRALRAALGCEVADSNAVFHGFPSLAEAETYVLGAGLQWPQDGQ